MVNLFSIIYCFLDWRVPGCTPISVHRSRRMQLSWLSFPFYSSFLRYWLALVACVLITVACGNGDQNPLSSSSSSVDPFVPGLANRPFSDTCSAGEAPSSGEFQLTRVWPAVGLRQPIGLVQLPGNPENDYFVMEKEGRILRLAADFNATSADVFLDLRGVVEAGGEGGVLSMAFHPNYPDKPYVYLSHMVDEDGFLMRISRFTSVDGVTATDEKRIFNLAQNLSPFGRGSIHNAGTLAFGADGYLYMSVGDDKRTFSAGQTDQLYGTIIRLDVDSDEDLAYTIPADNPFANEIYAYGFRNPWRLSFDRDTGDLWVGDVGEECFEEVNRVTKGRNYGWPNWEADVCGPGQCKGENTLPEYQYHTAKECGLGNSITGGYVYRGRSNPRLQGKYVYGDFQTGQVWAYDVQNRFNEDLFVSDRAQGLAAFGEDNQGELFYIDIQAGAIARLEGVQEKGVSGPPENLADTGCFDVLAGALVPDEGLVPYRVAQSFWSDGAEKQRFLSLPAGAAFTVDEGGDWELPVGGVLIKQFRLSEQNVETRFVVRYNNGTYGAYTYEWISADKAVLVDAVGKDAQLSDGREWRYPSRSECRQCHTTRAGFTLGPETRQMNVDQYYDETGRSANQIGTFSTLGMLQGKMEDLPAFPEVDDEQVGLAERSLAYLHVNCASCHRGTGGAQSIWDARITTPLAEKGLCNVPPITPVTGLPMEFYLNPGDHARSSIWWRVHGRGQGQMPPLASAVTDQAGAALLAAWIDAMPAAACSE